MRLVQKRVILQLSGPGRVFKGLGVAKAYCASESNGEGFVQCLSRPGGLLEARSLALGVPLHPVCQEELCNPGRDVSIMDQRGHLNRMLRLALPFFVDATFCAQTLAQMRRHPELAVWGGDSCLHEPHRRFSRDRSGAP